MAASHGMVALLELRRPPLEQFYSLWLNVVDATDPARPRSVGQLDLGLQEYRPGGDIAIHGSMVYIVRTDGPGVLIIDIADPAQPRIIATTDVYRGDRVPRAFLDGSRLYVSERRPDSPGILWHGVIDVSDPTHPVYAGEVHGLSLSTEHANGPSVVTAAADGRVLTAVDDMVALTRVNDPAQETSWSTWTTYSGANDVTEDALEYGRLLTVRGDADVAAVDARNEAALSADSHMTLPGFWYSQDVASGRTLDNKGLVYVADSRSQDSNFGTLDTSDPADLRLAGSIEIPDFTNDIAGSGAQAVLAVNHMETSGGPLFATTRTLGVRIVDARDPAAPQLAGSVWLPPILGRQASSASTLTVRGSTAYLGTPQGITVVDITHADAPVIMGETTRPTDIRALAAHAHQLLAAGDDLVLFDVSDPAQPRILKRLGLTTTGPVALDEVYAFVAVGPTVQVYRLDAAWPSPPEAEVQLAEPPQAILRNAATGLLAVADGIGGLYTLRLRPVSPWKIWLPRLVTGRFSSDVR
jgi:hypothetical protein